MEEWRDIKGYEGLYMVSNLGNVKSLNYLRNGKEGILKPKEDRYGYMQVVIRKDGKNKNYTVHRLVAQAFLPNPDNLPQVNHKDEDKTNNNVDNLEWCSPKYNLNYGTRNKRASEKKIKPVIGINEVSGLILEFPSTVEAERQTGIANQNISACCRGRQKSAGGYYWYYADADAE